MKTIMKNLLLLLIIAGMAGCSNKIEHKRRYFMIGYYSNSQQGNFYQNSDTMPTVDDLNRSTLEAINCDRPLEKNVIITGLFEFADSNEYNHFKNGRNRPLCDK